MNKKLTKEQQLYIDKQLEFAEELYNKSDEQLKEVYKAQLSNRNEILTDIANTMLSYNIADSKLAISIAEKKKLKEKLSKVIRDKIQEELINESNLTDEILKTTGKEKYNINNYLHDIGMNVSWNIKPVDDETLKNVINTKVDNKLWSDRLWDNKNTLQKDLQLEVNNFLNGKTSVNEIEAKIKKKYNSNAYNTKRLVQDNICRVQEGINNVWQQEHNIKYVLYMATLDGHICANCAQYDGKPFEIDKKPVEIPQHPFCRCCYTSIPNENWRPKMRLDNETKEKINWQSYEEWMSNKPFAMNLQLFGKNTKDNWELLQQKIESGIIDNDKFEMCYNEFNKVFKKGVKTPLEHIKCNNTTFAHIAQRHPYMINLEEINRIKHTLLNPNSIYEVQDKHGFKANGYISKFEEDTLLIVVRNDIITAYYPNEKYLNKNIIEGGNLLWERK
ncbi:MULTISPECIES: minor capsid protein [unclassified Clostridium]|uniref:minor capsid protein n=1 Tax=unclassified Clostridium TaxID=2614128 RepID=UPI002079588D|nr:MULTISPECIES: minor capsid protein [unclassified Clostridium]